MKNLLLALALVIASPALAATYKIDPAHTFVLFKAGHLGFSHTYGMFSDIAGQFSLDNKKPEDDKVEIKIKVDSLDTKNAKRDKHLKSPDFFNVKQFPLITFKSTTLKKKAGNIYEVNGNLSLHGKTHPVTFDLQRLRTGPGPGGAERTGGDATLTIKRSDFGMNYMLGENAVSDEIDIILSVEGVVE